MSQLEPSLPQSTPAIVVEIGAVHARLIRAAMLVLLLMLIFNVVNLLFFLPSGNHITVTAGEGSISASVKRLWTFEVTWWGLVFCVGVMSLTFFRVKQWFFRLAGVFLTGTCVWMMITGVDLFLAPGVGEELTQDHFTSSMGTWTSPDVRTVNFRDVLYLSIQPQKKPTRPGTKLRAYELHFVGPDTSTVIPINDPVYKLLPHLLKRLRESDIASMENREGVHIPRDMAPGYPLDWSILDAKN